MSEIIPFKPNKSIQRADQYNEAESKWSFVVGETIYEWSTSKEKVDVIRCRLPYESIEIISDKADMPVKYMLVLLSLAQTTYNKKLREHDLMSPRDSELIVEMTELIDFGISVFNDEEEKFRRWLKKPNISLGGETPVSFFDSLTGIQEVRNALNRLEYGNMS